MVGWESHSTWIGWTKTSAKRFSGFDKFVCFTEEDAHQFPTDTSQSSHKLWLYVKSMFCVAAVNCCGKPGVMRSWSLTLNIFFNEAEVNIETCCKLHTHISHKCVAPHAGMCSCTQTFYTHPRTLSSSLIQETCPPCDCDPSDIFLLDTAPSATHICFKAIVLALVYTDNLH